MKREFRQIDVFGQDPYTGNPVAVVLDADGVDTEDLRRFSVWSNLSECTFVLPPTDPAADYRVRIFNLAIELPFAGHPTLGTARAWLDAGGVPATPGVVVQECGVGLVPIRIDGETLAFVAPPRLRTGPVDAELVATVAAILGIRPEEIAAAEWLDNGPGWIGILLDDADAALALTPDVSGHPGPWDIGVIAPIAGAEADAPAFELRGFFTDGTGPLIEDPVTGSLNAAAAQWLLASGRATAPYTARQGTALGRKGVIRITESDGDIWVGGRTHVALSGTADL
ncbi:PhzF family phenazine biosynthesis protein [Microbacterium thalassium]|uniref:PhzF family phenazine biosynthesis protein n=1 Tax=Microbacterium thalassium TaxID=362649 RepID=A0A7X0KTQ8_9MICO|nr:PhzF family phenazine biosynthesis protein [Microbacterium thalassium]MBB6390376.1 PhzF family phenazine biosynthesis protein [Microbacterium thalassium]GLK25485.1 phenazine biosynthesis protein PhzF [Microbacterium thalassium]